MRNSDGAALTFVYDDATGERRPFSPERAARELAGCIICGGPVGVVGVFQPESDEMLTSILRLRTQPLRECSTPGLVYGLCRWHAADPDLDRIEAVILRCAATVKVQ